MKIVTETKAEELVASALNEQGYLLQHKIGHVLETPEADGTYTHNWYIDAEEVPVLQWNDDTRVDLVLRNGPKAEGCWRVVVECKRAARDFKRWVFFGKSKRTRGPSSRKYYFESADLTAAWNQSEQRDPPMMHRLNAVPSVPECEVFDYGIEVKMERPDREKKVSATVAIEDALFQATLGQAGLSQHLRATREIKFRIIPVVVTTAQLLCADFNIEEVSLEQGCIAGDDLTLAPREWLAVNYRVNESISQNSRFTVNRSSDIAAHLSLWQVRSVFVVQAGHIQKFLAWLGNRIDDWS